MEEIPWRFQIGNWYQENGIYVVVCAMFIGVVAWFLVGGILYEYRQKARERPPRFRKLGVLCRNWYRRWFGN